MQGGRLDPGVVRDHGHAERLGGRPGLGQRVGLEGLPHFWRQLHAFRKRRDGETVGREHPRNLKYLVGVTGCEDQLHRHLTTLASGADRLVLRGMELSDPEFSECQEVVQVRA
jgi:hypothetical protein